MYQKIDDDSHDNGLKKRESSATETTFDFDRNVA